MNITIAGTSITTFGELWHLSLKDLLKTATLEAVADADLELSEIEAVYVANKAGGSFENQLHLGAMVSQFFPHHPPALRVEGACASGGLALMTAEQALISGQYQTVLVVGAEKMTDVSAQETTQILASAADMEEEYGSTFPGLYALLAQQHMAEFGTTRQQLSAVAVKNHAFAMNNPFAQYHKQFSLEQVSASAPVADPLRLLDCSPISDGAATVVLTTKRVKDKPRVLGSGHGQDSLDLAHRNSLTSLAATKRAMRQALDTAQIKQQHISVAEVHDCFTIAEILAIEDLGFFEKGQGGQATLSGKTGLDVGLKKSAAKSKSNKLGSRRITINPSGGLKACGHPVGATGVKQVAYLARLLEDGEHQYALAHNVGGSGATAVVHVLGK